MRSLTFEVFMEDDGILKSTISLFYHSDYFLLQRKIVYMTFLTVIMTTATSCLEVNHLLYDLAKGYLGLYEKFVTSVGGTIEKRQKAGKIMIQNFELNRVVLQDLFRIKFRSLQSISAILVNTEVESSGCTSYEDSNLVFGYLDKFIYECFWKWLHLEKGIDVSDFIKERDSDIKFPYSAIMLDKVYDITGYLCGSRLKNMLNYNRLRKDYIFVFTEYYKESRYPNGSMAVLDGLPAEFLIFRQHSEGLYFARAANFNFIKIVQAIFMQSLSTDVLILFNAMEPVKLVQKVILNSKIVQNLFKESCLTLSAHFTDSTDLVCDNDPIGYLFRFLIEGFIRVYSKDIYQLRLSNVLLSKTGASGIRTNLLTLSDNSVKKKKENSALPSLNAIPLNTSSVIDSSTLNIMC